MKGTLHDPRARVAGRGPRLARWLLRWSIPEPAVEAILGDIEEGYASRGSRVWYWSQVCGSITRWWRRRRLAGEIREDLRMAVRRLRLHPGFSLVVVGTLALGIGANAAAFTVVNAVLLAPLPYPDPTRLVAVRADLPDQGAINSAISPPELVDIAQYARSFDSIGGIWYRPAALTDDAAEPEDIDMAFVSAGLLPAVGVEAMLGRHPLADEDLEGGERVIVLSEGLWRRRYGAAADIVGKRIEMDDEPHTVVGVMPGSFRLHLPPDVAVPVRVDAWVTFGGAYDAYPRSWRIFTLIGRLRAGATRLDATTELTSLAASLREQHADYAGTGYELRAEALDASVVAEARPLLLLLGGAVGMVLLIVCANVANLYLLRAGKARREILVRRALGATRGRLLRAICIDCALVTGLGAAAGILLTQWGVSAAPSLAPAELPRLNEIGLDLRAVGFAAGLAGITALVLAAVSALQVERFGTALRHGSRASGTHAGAHVRRVLLISELAVSLMLLIGVGLMARSFSNLTTIDMGFDLRDVTTIKISLVDTHFPYTEPRKITGFYARLTEGVAALPGVDAAGITSYLPTATRFTAPYVVDRADGVSEWGTTSADYHHISPGWLEAMNAVLLAGRLFEPRDDLDHPNVAIVDDKLAAVAWPDNDPLGKRIQVEIFVDAEWQRVWAEVVGVVRHMRHDPASDGIEQVFLPHAQSPMRTTVLTIRSNNELSSLAASVAALVRDIDDDQPIGLALPMSAYVDESVAAHRFALTLLSAFSALALALALVGTYGVVSYSVAQRRREIGIQIAIGATPSAVVRSIVIDGGKLALVGISVGVVGALGLARFLASLLYDVAPTDPVTFVSMAVAMTLVTLGACYLPARRASRLDPTSALRCD